MKRFLLRRRRGLTRLVNAARLAAALGFVAIATSGPAVSQRTEENIRITAVRHWSLNDVTRVVVEASGPLRYHSDRLRNPDRVFFDITNSRPSLNEDPGGHGVAVLSIHDRLLRQIRVAETQRGITRIVFDLNVDLEFSTSILANPDRLVIEFRTPLLTRRPVPQDPIEVISARVIPTQPQIERKPIRYAHLFFSPRPIPRLEPLPDPPSPFDYSLRFATRQFMKSDPLRSAWWAPHVESLPRFIPPRPAPLVAAVSAPPVRVPARTAVPEPSVVPESRNQPAPRNSTGDIALPAQPSGEHDSMIRVLGLKLGRVVIDPGHGGHDVGTIGSGGIYEKDIALDVSKRLGALLQANLGSDVFYTRTDDTFIPLGRRTAIANELRADLFISIHVNSSTAESVAGFETYYLSLTDQREARETAMRENAASQKNIGELQDLLKRIALQDKIVESREFANSVQSSMLALAPKNLRTAQDRGVKRAPFVVLIGASMPSILAEIGFITNAREVALMKKAEYRERIAEALYRGIAAYAATLSHFQTTQSDATRSTPAGFAAR